MEIQQAPGSLTAVQRQAVSIWPDEKLQGGPVRFYRGCVNTLVYYVGITERLMKWNHRSFCPKVGS